jgi:hypothetical protein
MTSPKPQELFDALGRGEKVEVWNDPVWEEWFGKMWHYSCQYRIVKPKKTVVLYEYFCREGDYYWITDLQSYAPTSTCIVRRLDETRMEVEVEE